MANFGILIPYFNGHPKITWTVKLYKPNNISVHEGGCQKICPRGLWKAPYERKYETNQQVRPV